LISNRLEEVHLILPNLQAPARRSDVVEPQIPTEMLVGELSEFLQDLRVDMEPADLSDFYALVGQSLESSFSAYEQALLLGDLSAAWRSLHRLRNVVGGIGAATLDACMSQLERDLREGIDEKATYGLTALKRDLKIVESFVAELLEFHLKSGSGPSEQSAPEIPSYVVEVSENGSAL
jgi:HPt (histidine-containing phosphotransfer) domain-containing protein